MSFGFGVGDFIAVGELCWKLYSQVYEVSRGAPEAIQNLKAELGDMHLTIKKLIEDTKDPDSILVQSGSDRLNLACSVLEKTRDTLQKLDDLSVKYELLQKPSSNMAKRHFWKRNYDKVKFAAESRTINDLRAKLVFHNGQISLLLQMVQNSSLERIENMQKKTENALQDIKAALSGSASKGHTPLLSGFNGADQHRMTRKLMEKAEVDGRSWTSIGIREWLQTGKWWLLKAQSQLYSAAPQVPEYSQAWVDLIKASWILTDIIALHPQRGFFGSGIQEMDILDIVQAVKTQHEDLEKKSLPRPALDDLEGSNWEIWIFSLSTALLPSLGEIGPNSGQWGTHGGFILFQRFAVLHTSTGNYECIVFLEVKSNEETFTLIAQSFEGRDLWRYSDYDTHFWDTRSRMVGIRHGKEMDLDEKNSLVFSNRDDLLTVFLLTTGVKLCMEHAAGSQCGESLIYAMTLFDILSIASPSLEEEVKVIKPRFEELIYGSSNIQLGSSELLWNLMKIPLSQKPADFHEMMLGLSWSPRQRHQWFILNFSESLEQCDTIFTSFPGLVEDDIRNIIRGAARVLENIHLCITTNTIGHPDGHVVFEMQWLREFLKHTSESEVLTHEVVHALLHMPASSDVSPLGLVRVSLECRNWHGISYILKKDGKTGMNNTLPSEFWNLEIALALMDHYDGPSSVLALFDERLSTLNVFKEAPCRTTFVVIADGLVTAAMHLRLRGLLDPNLPPFVNGDGVDVLSSMHRSGIPHWPLRMAINMCSFPSLIEFLCEAGAHLGGDDDVLYSDLEVYKALLSRSESQAREICRHTAALVRAAVNRPEPQTDESMVPAALISRGGPDTWFLSRCPSGPSIQHRGVEFKEWRPYILSIIRKTQTQRNALAWLRANATITTAFE